MAFREVAGFLRDSLLLDSIEIKMREEGLVRLWGLSTARTTQDGE